MLFRSLSLNIDTHDNSLDLNLAKSVGQFFQLTVPQMDTIIEEVIAAVRNWKAIANEIGIARSEQELMQRAFRY